MGKWVVLLLSLGLVLFGGYLYLHHQGSPSSRAQPRSSPIEVLDQAKDSAKQIEQDAQERVDGLMKGLD